MGMRSEMQEILRTRGGKTVLTSFVNNFFNKINMICFH